MVLVCLPSDALLQHLPSYLGLSYLGRGVSLHGRWRSSIQSAKTRMGADCGSDHELLIAKFRLKLKKVGKTTRPFRHDLNQIPYDYTVEVRNRFKGLDLIECLMNYGWRLMTLYR